jgi:hypothetical protein
MLRYATLLGHPFLAIFTHAAKTIKETHGVEGVASGGIYSQTLALLDM